ncbi:MAG: hypothetical protein ACXVSE_05630 [Solirubrobacteraceae bacterium]
MSPHWRNKRVDWVLLAGSVAGIAVVLAVSLGLISLPGTRAGAQSAQASDAASLAAQRLAANRRWASTACTSVLNWKNEIQRDVTSLDLSFGALPRIQGAITATTRMLNTLDTLGPPPSAQTGQARADLERLRSDLEARLHAIESDAHRMASGHLTAIPALLNDLKSDQAVAPQLAGAMRRVVSVDLGLSLAETRACRQLVGIPI